MLVVTVLLLAGVTGLVIRKGRRRAAGRRSALIINGPAVVETAGVDIVYRSIEELAFTVESGQVRITETVDGRDLAEFGLVQVTAYPRPTASLINAIADYLDHHRVPAINMAGIGAPTKLGQYVRLAQAGLPVPDTCYAAPQVLATSYATLAERLDLPFVLKGLSGSGGCNNFLITDEGDLHRHLPIVTSRFLAQRFIPNDTTYRMFVLGDEVALIMRRTWAPGTHLTNTAQGGSATLIEPEYFDPAIQHLAVRAARLVGSEIAGVNLIQHWSSGQWYVLDVNPNPTITSGAFVEEKLAAYQSYLYRRLGLDSQLSTGRKV